MPGNQELLPQPASSFFHEFHGISSQVKRDEERKIEEAKRKKQQEAVTVLRRYFVGGGQRFSLSPVFLSENTSRTRARRVAEVSSSKECCTIGSKDKFCRKELE